MQKKIFVIFHPHDRNRRLSRIGNHRNSTHFVMSLHKCSFPADQHKEVHRKQSKPSHP